MSLVPKNNIVNREIYRYVLEHILIRINPAFLPTDILQFTYTNRFPCSFERFMNEINNHQIELNQRQEPSSDNIHHYICNKNIMRYIYNIFLREV